MRKKERWGKISSPHAHMGVRGSKGEKDSPPSLYAQARKGRGEFSFVLPPLTGAHACKQERKRKFPPPPYASTRARAREQQREEEEQKAEEKKEEGKREGEALLLPHKCARFWGEDEKDKRGRVPLLAFSPLCEKIFRREEITEG